jgi:hypothetical protein
MDPLLKYGSLAFLTYSKDTHSEPKLSKPAAPLQCTQSPPIEEQPLQVHNASSWTYCGPLLTPSGAHLPPSFHTWASLTFSAPSILLDRLLPLLAFLQDFLPRAGAHHYWLSIRATEPNHEFDTPRWHTDDDLFTQNAGIRDAGGQAPAQSQRWKLATTLLGPSTLFLADSAHGRRVQSEAKRSECEKRVDHRCTSVRCVGCSDAGRVVRQRLMQALCNEQVVSPARSEVAFFRIGDEDGVVHSEPRCNVDRIFVNVTPGTEADLRALMGRWQMGFPRAWCFGMPVGFVMSDEMGVAEGEEVKNVERGDSEGVGARGTKGRVREECEAWLDRKGLGFVKGIQWSAWSGS